MSGSSFPPRVVSPDVREELGCHLRYSYYVEAKPGPGCGTRGSTRGRGRRVSEGCCPPCETTRGVYGYSQLGPQDGDNRRLAAARATDECNGVRRDDVRPDFSGGIS